MLKKIVSNKENSSKYEEIIRIFKNYCFFFVTSPLNKLEIHWAQMSFEQVEQ